MSRRPFVLINDEVRARAVQAVREAPVGHMVTLKEPGRNLGQNAAMWGILQAFSEQLLWPVNGTLSRMSPEDWKDLLSAAFKRQARVAVGLDGGVVMLGQSTSRFTKREFSDFIEFLHATAADRGVVVYADAAPASVAA